MKTLLVVFLTAGMCIASSAPQPPVILGLLNNYSFVQPGLPNYGIAQGSIFDIFGTNLADESGPLQSVPLKTTLSGVSASVTVAGVTVPLILYFVQPGQVAAILPSSTPPGSGNVTLTNKGQASLPFPIQVIPSAFGVLTLNGEGYGAAAVFDSTYALLDFTKAVNPGESITIWGTGLGPVTEDETNFQTQQDLVNIPIEVDIGGVPATVLYHGRSSYPGLDQINAIVPSGLQGCFVSMVVKTGSVVSNFATIPVAASGRTCSDPTLGVSAAQLQTLGSDSFFVRGTIVLNKDVTRTPGATPTVTTTESASALFIDVPGSLSLTGNLFAGLGASLGSCMVYGIDSSGKIVGPDFTRGTSLDAGSALMVSGPNGSSRMAVADPSKIYLYTEVFNPGFIPDTGGTFSVDHIPNDPETGADIKVPIGARITMPPPLVWSNQSGMTSVNRSAGVTVKWTGGDPGTYVSIVGSSILSAGSQVGAYFNCSAPLSDGEFSVPAAVLMSLPPSTQVSASTFLRVGNITSAQNFSTAGVDIGIISAGWSFTTNLTYQ